MVRGAEGRGKRGERDGQVYEEYDEEVQDAEAAEEAAMSGMPKVDKEQELKPFIQSGFVQPFIPHCVTRPTLCARLALLCRVVHHVWRSAPCAAYCRVSWVLRNVCLDPASWCMLHCVLGCACRGGGRRPEGEKPEGTSCDMSGEM